MLLIFKLFFSYNYSTFILSKYININLKRVCVSKFEVYFYCKLLSSKKLVNVFFEMKYEKIQNTKESCHTDKDYSNFLNVSDTSNLKLLISKCFEFPYSRMLLNDNLNYLKEWNFPLNTCLNTSNGTHPKKYQKGEKKEVNNANTPLIAVVFLGISIPIYMVMCFVFRKKKCNSGKKNLLNGGNY